ncbi:HDIG domain-containing protein [soil metagenome]
MAALNHMGIAEKLGMGQKPGRRPRRRGLRMERVPQASVEKMDRRSVLTRLGLLAILVFLSLLAFPRVALFVAPDLAVGEVWMRPELVAPFDFAIRYTEEENQARLDSVRQSVPMVFALNRQAADQTAQRLNALNRRLDSTFVEYANWQLARQEGISASQDSAAFIERQLQFGGMFTPSQWEIMLNSYAAQVPGLESPLRTPDRPPITALLTVQLQNISRDLLTAAVLSVPRDSVRSDFLEVRDQETFQYQSVDLRDPAYRVYGLEESVTFVRNRLGQAFGARTDTVAIGTAMFRTSLVPTFQFLRDESREELERELTRLSPTYDNISDGESIVRRGDRVTADILNRVRSLELAQRERSGELGRWQSWTGQFLLSLIALSIFFLYLILLRRQLFQEERFVILMTLLFGLVIIGYGLVNWTGMSNWVVPVALVSILLTIIFDSRVALIATVSLAVLGGLLLDVKFQFTFATIFAGMIAVFSVRDVKNRAQLLVTSGLVFVAYALILSGFALVRIGAFSPEDLLFALLNAGLLLLAYPLLWVIEKSFRVTTDLTLLELSDTNRPLLRELSLRAPGTFSHVLQVANLSEAAGDAIGANALKARVGALYHDIGKMLKPEYYIENQQQGDNPHDRVSPYMSALIIGSHVKEGMELGREHQLPEVVLDFITSHHGTARIDYFFRKAEAMREPDDGPVDEAEFRYPGPRPKTTEQGIVMLADSVEATCRSLQKPTHKRIEETIDHIFNERIKDGQLADTGLTFSDLTRIKATFLSILGGVYHVRIKYPSQQDAEAADEEPAGPPANVDPEVALPTPSVEEEAPQAKEDSTPEIDPSRRHL